VLGFGARGERESETSERESCCEVRRRNEQRKEMCCHGMFPHVFTGVHSLVHYIIVKKKNLNVFNSLQQWDP
jgi:hypothetical protein